MLTEKDYCDYDTSVALRELRYVGICDAYYELTGNDSYNRDSFELLYTRDFIHPDDKDRVAAPLLYQAQKWLREEKGLFVEVVMSYGKYDFDICSTKLEQNMTHKILCEIWGFKTYEEALSEGIKETVKILKEE